MACYFGSDMQVVDPARVVRLTGSLHLKQAVPAQYRIYKDESYGDYSDYETIVDTFPLDPLQQATYDAKTAPKKALNIGDGYNHDAAYRSQLINWLAVKAEPAVKGNGRSFQFIRALGMAHDLGIPCDEAKQISWEHYNPRCVPPYTEQERARKHDTYVERAYKYANNEVGCRTSAGVFAQAEMDGEITIVKSDYKPAESSEKEIEFERYDGVEREEVTDAMAAAMKAQLTSKSPLNDMAKCFADYNFPNRGLIRNNKIWYKFNGKCWEEVSDDEIRSAVFYEYGMSNFKLPPSKISNISTALEDYCYQTNVRNNHWLDGSKKDGRDEATVVFQNGVLRITPTSTHFDKHDSRFFTLNCLPYDYDPDADCPEFKKWLDEIFDDKALINIISEFGGYTLTADTRFQVFLLLEGKSRSGKGTLSEVIRQVIGVDNTMSPAINQLTMNYVLNGLSHSKLATIPEANNIDPRMKAQVTDIIKSLSGNDQLTFDRKYSVQPISCSDWPKLIFSANEVPDFADGSGALANRCIPIPFRKSFVGKEDRGLVERLVGESAGIMNFFIKGFQALYSNGHFTHSEASKAVVNELRQDMFLLSDFAEKHLTVEEGVTSSCDEVYDAYMFYSRMNGVKSPFSKIKVGKILSSSYLNIIKDKVSINGKQVRGYIGVRVNNESLKPQVVQNVAQFPATPVAANTNQPKQN